MNPVSVGVMGVMAGAAIGSIATIAFKDERTRQRLNDTVAHVKGQAMSVYETLKKDYFSKSSPIDTGDQKTLKENITDKKNKSIYS